MERGISFSKLHISLLFEYLIGQVLLAKLQGESNCDTKFSPPYQPGYCGEAQNSPERLGTSRDPNLGSGGQLSTQGVKDIV